MTHARIKIALLVIFAALGIVALVRGNVVVAAICAAYIALEPVSKNPLWGTRR